MRWFKKLKPWQKGAIIGLIFYILYFSLFSFSRGPYLECFNSLPRVCVAQDGRIIDNSLPGHETCTLSRLEEDSLRCEKGIVGFHKIVYETLNTVDKNFLFYFRFLSLTPLPGALFVIVFPFPFIIGHSLGAISYAIIGALIGRFWKKKK